MSFCSWFHLTRLIRVCLVFLFAIALAPRGGLRRGQGVGREGRDPDLPGRAARTEPDVLLRTRTRKARRDPSILIRCTTPSPARRSTRPTPLVYLENEYIRIGILPEIGGRIFEGVDKTNNYNFIYRQHVIKPALIGLIGAWISGGVEWNIPHHHRASTFIPVQYRVEENADGSKTVWVGELEVRQRMRWAVGYTLRPGKAYLEASVRILNRTPVVNTMLCFANVAVHANDNYQVIFPPSTQYGTCHGKREFTAVAGLRHQFAAAPISPRASTSVGTRTTSAPTPSSPGITRTISSPATTTASRPAP